MGYREVFAKINDGTVGGILIFYGPEEYVKDRTLDALRAKLVPAELEQLNYTYLEGERANAAEIRRSAETLPFLTEKRLVVVRDYAMLASSSRGSGLDTRKESAELELMVRDFSPTTCLVFLQRLPADATKAAWKLLAKHAELVEFARLTDRELVTQITRACKRLDCSISNDDAMYLIQYCGTDMETLSREAMKACNHAGHGATVTRRDIEAVCIQTQESKVFQFIDQLFAGQGTPAMAQLRALSGESEGVSALLSLIARQARIMAAVKAAGRSMDSRALASNLGVPPFAVDASARAARNWSQQALAQAVQACAEADLSIKQGLTSDQTAVELLAMRILQMAADSRK